MDNDLQLDKQIKNVIQNEKLQVPQLISERIEETIKTIPNVTLNRKKVNKKIFFAIAVLFTIIPLTAYGTSYFQRKNIVFTYTKLNTITDNKIEDKIFKDIKTKKPNQYYYVFLQQDKFSTAFIPQKLNKGYKPNSDVHITNFFNSDGTVIEDEKMILINDYLITDSVKKKIKEIVGEKNYVEALREIEDRVNTLKETIYY